MIRIINTGNKNGAKGKRKDSKMELVGRLVYKACVSMSYTCLISGPANIESGEVSDKIILYIHCTKMYAITFYNLDVDWPLLWPQTFIKKGKKWFIKFSTCEVKTNNKNDHSWDQGQIFLLRYSSIRQWIIRAPIINSVLTLKAVISVCSVGLSFRFLAEARSIEVRQDSVKAILWHIS